MAVRYVLNSKGRYVPDHESDLLMDSIQYGNWLGSLCRRLPETIKDDESLTGKRLPTVNEMIGSLRYVYTERDLGKKFHYEALPEEKQRRRRQTFLDNHFKIPEKHSRKDELEEIKSKALKTDNYDELQILLTGLLNKRYRDRQVPHIYKKARKLAVKRAGEFVGDKSGLEEMNKELEYRKPTPVTLFSQEELAPFIQGAAKPHKREKPGAKTAYMLNSEGRYVPGEESDLIMDEEGYMEFQQSLLHKLKGETEGEGHEKKKGIGPTEVLKNIASYLFEKEARVWNILPNEVKCYKMESLCETHDLPPGISSREEFIEAFVKFKKELWAGETPRGKKDYKKVYAIYSDLIGKQIKDNEKPISPESINEINNDLRFPEPYQLTLIF